MKRLSIFLLCLTLIAGSISAPALAGEMPFGEEVQPLSSTEMEEIDGEYKHLLFGAAAGAVFNTTSYLITTPRRKWSFRAGLRHAIAGAVSGAGAASLRF